MSPLLRRSVSAGARPCPGRSSSGLTALRGLHLGHRLRSGVYMAANEKQGQSRSANRSVHAFRGTAQDLTPGAGWGPVLSQMLRPMALARDPKRPAACTALRRL